MTTVVFGDGEFGQIPPAGTRIVASYRVGGGSVGNVGAGQIATIARAPQLQLLGARVLNRTAATGGSDREAEARAIKLAPIAFSSMQRAVTRADYAAHALLVAGVAKARVDPTNWNVVRLYVAPAGGG